MKHNLLYAVVLAVIAGLFWTIGRSQPQPQLRGGPVPPAATVVLEGTTKTGFAIQQVYAFDEHGNSMYSRTTPKGGTKRVVRNRVDGMALSFDGSLGAVVENDLSTRDQLVLDRRFLGNNPECETDRPQGILYNANPAIGSILGYRVVKHTYVSERPACSDGTCPAESWMDEKWFAPELGCLPLRHRQTFTNQESGEVRAIVDQTAVSVTLGADPSLFARGSAEKIKPTELLRRQAQRRAELRERLDRRRKMAEQAGWDEQAR